MLACPFISDLNLEDLKWYSAPPPPLLPCSAILPLAWKVLFFFFEQGNIFQLFFKQGKQNNTKEDKKNETKSLGRPTVGRSGAWKLF